ncbi:MAG: flagellar hook-basal body complex protein [Gaiellales bacterium]
MFSAISGLRVHQAMLDVTANDIANVNTVGYKSERTSFKDALSQMQKGASAATASLGGTNAAQVGLGVQMSSIDNQMNAGAIQSTGNTFDLAIQGDGWFRVTDDPTGFSRIYYTRAGNFTRDSAGDLVSPEGYYLVGRTSGGADTKITVPATVDSVTVGQNGDVTTVTAGVSAVAATINLAKFPNDTGLQRMSGNKFGETQNSGAPTILAPGVSGAGLITPGAVEMSNVDLAQEFTDMITAQRGFQANSRVISAADEMLQELVNLKR